MLISTILREKGAEVFTIDPMISLEAASQALHRHRVGALVVTDGDGRIVGVLSERDIIRELARKGPKALSDTVGDVMTRAVVTAEPHTTVDDGLARMTDRRIRHLPIVEATKLVGVVSIGDLVKAKIAVTEADAHALRSYIATA